MTHVTKTLKIYVKKKLKNIDWSLARIDHDYHTKNNLPF